MLEFLLCAAVDAWRKNSQDINGVKMAPAEMLPLTIFWVRHGSANNSRTQPHWPSADHVFYTCLKFFLSLKFLHAFCVLVVQSEHFHNPSDCKEY